MQIKNIYIHTTFFFDKIKKTSDLYINLPNIKMTDIYIFNQKKFYKNRICFRINSKYK